MFNSEKGLYNKHIHFVGIKGTGIAALVEICAYHHAIISGSDVEDVFYTDEILKNLGITPTVFSKKNISSEIDIVVYSSAYLIDKNPELIAATELGIPCINYAEALGAVSSGAISCGIAGVHGKTSTTAICGTILEELNLPVQVLAGSVVSSFKTDGKKSCSHGSCTLNIGKKYFIAETCEYQRHFMNFHPDQIILTSVESDHQDFYPTYEDIRDAFVDYCCLLPSGGKLIYCCDDKGACDVVSIVTKTRPDIVLSPYGFTATGSFRIFNYSVAKGKQQFCLEAFEPDNVFTLFVPGEHNVLNSAASIALACNILYRETEKKLSESSFIESELHEKKYDLISTGLKKFHGSRRRCEVLADKKVPLPFTVIDDYGHHPTAIKKTIEGLRTFYSDRYIIVDFMSHTYTRTAALLDRFASCFGDADMVIINKIYSSAREKYTGTIDGKKLYEETKKYHSNVVYAHEFEDASVMIAKVLEKNPANLKSGSNRGSVNSSVKKGFLLVSMGAGDNWKVSTKILDMIKNKQIALYKAEI
ncbi:MAG: UDP-N-acetylmuramate--L-alanine ligase [Treponema sp. CETP13]|nr:MAG: UDP-N-acetylmuramate--L-alanine ligase [Treponema sp. CETP13]